MSTRSALTLRAIAAVELVAHLAIELDAHGAHLGRRACTATASALPTAVRAIVRSMLHRALGRDDAELELAVVGLRVLEHLDAAEQLADVAEQDAATPGP